MKRTGNLIDAIAELENLRLAFWKARKGKSYSKEVNAYRSELENNLKELQLQIVQGKVVVGDYRYFKVFDPKERQICASAFREQVLHHALMNHCHALFERIQIDQSYASRKGKGTYAALNKAMEFTHRYTFFLKLDVRKFFDSIQHEVLKRQLFRLIKDFKVLDILYAIIDSYEVTPARGVPIGNLSSQYFANHYLAALDHYIKEELRIKAYVRYMDDMILWHGEKEVLKEAYRKIKNYVETQLSCELKVPLLNYSTCGLPFLGYILRPHNIKLTQNSRKRFKRKMHFIESQYHSGAWSEEQCQRHALPLIAFTAHANANALRRKIIFT